MMPALIGPDDLPEWVPGRALISDGAGKWNGVEVCAYQYGPLEVSLPPLRDFMIIGYNRFGTVWRSLDGRWHSESLAVGECSLVNKETSSNWRWSCNLENTLIHLPHRTIAEIAAEMFDRDVKNVQIRDVLKVDDPVLRFAVQTLEREARHPTHGSSLFVDAMTRGLCIHLLRNYSTFNYRESATPGMLPRRQAREVAEYIEVNLAQQISLPKLACLIGVSPHHFYRQFKSRFGCSPHSYVMQQRLAHAQRLISRGGRPLKEIASACGFYDQSHMNRLFRKMLNTTPKALELASRR